MFLTLTWKNQTWQFKLSPGKTKRGSYTLVRVRLWLGGYRSDDANIVLDIRYAHDNNMSPSFKSFDIFSHLFQISCKRDSVLEWDFTIMFNSCKIIAL